MDNRTFRDAMGKFTTGVTIIATQEGEDIHGMTANAFMSVSLEPKLITISVDNKANMLDKVNESQQFSVNILSDEQQDISMHFAGQTNEDREVDFNFMEGIPVLDGALVSVICNVNTSYVVGDHTLFIGEVIDIKTNEGNPLTFFCGEYGVNSVVS